MIGEDDHTKWLLWRELDINNVFENLNSVLVPFLESVNEPDMLELYKSYMTSTTQSMFDSVYPDKSLSNSYDIKKARITPYVARLMLKYGDDDFGVTREYQETALLTATGELSFLEQSPDTRAETFAGAVIHESRLRGPGGYRTVTNYLINYINGHLEAGTSVSDVFSCTSKDSAANDRVPLYTGNCIESIYFAALARSTSSGWAYILDNIDSRLRSELAVRFARNISGKQNIPSITKHVSENDRSRFVTAACVGMSASGHEAIIDEIVQTFGGDLGSAAASCAATMIQNQDLLDLHLTPITQFLCNEVNFHHIIDLTNL